MKCRLQDSGRRCLAEVDLGENARKFCFVRKGALRARRSEQSLPATWRKLCQRSAEWSRKGNEKGCESFFQEKNSIGATYLNFMAEVMGLESNVL